MKRIFVYFNFETDEQWLEFGKNFYDGKKFEPYWIPFVKSFMDEHKTFEHLFKNDIRPTWDIDENGNDVEGTPEPFIIALPCVSTKSKKVLKVLYNWIKENHYEHNYELCEIKGEGFSILQKDFNELLNGV